MKIVFVTASMRASALASSFRVRRFLEFFVSKGHDVVVVCKFPPEESTNIEGVRIICVDFHYHGVKKVIYRVLGLPDPSAIWAHACYRNKEVRESIAGADVILASSPPHGLQKLSLLLKKEFSIPLVCDFRDDFLTNHRTRWLTPIHKFFGRRLECELVKEAERVILNTTEVQARFESRYPS